MTLVREAPLEQTEFGLVPKGEGWFVVNAKESRWIEHDAFGSGTTFEGDPEFAQLGINIGVLSPGQPACLYHRETAQEDFLVLSGECLLLVEGEERPLKQWDFVHCPPGTDHVFVGAGEGPSAILAVGARAHQDLVYPVSELAGRYGASAERETPDPKEAYAPFGRGSEAPYRGQLDGAS
ncbi:MAG: cupin domain-containing protein [Actinobacteria bacterium]|nr:MAG: cupin domain-containing protein [Actinomycetota bacterium]